MDGTVPPAAMPGPAASRQVPERPTAVGEALLLPLKGGWFGCALCPHRDTRSKSRNSRRGGRRPSSAAAERRAQAESDGCAQGCLGSVS